MDSLDVGVKIWSQSTRWRWAAALIATTALLAACGDDEPPAQTPDTSAADTTPDTADADTSPPPPETFDRGAPLAVWFTYRDNERLRQGLPLYRLTTDDAGSNLSADKLTLASRALDCGLGRCWVTEDGQILVLQESTGGRISLIRRDAGGAFDGSAGRVIANGAAQIEVIGSRLAYIASNSIHYLDLASNANGAPAQLVAVSMTGADGISYTTGGVALDKTAPQMLVYRASAGLLAVSKLDLTTGLEAPLFRLGIPNATSPLSYATTNPVAFSSDGAVAVTLLEGPMLYDVCTTQADCEPLGEAALCLFARNRAGEQSERGLCALPQKALVRFQVTSSDLGQACEDDAGCSPAHRCAPDPSALFAQDQTSICVPRALVLGPSLPPNQGCDKLKASDFSQIIPKLRRNHLNQVLLLTRLERTCSGLNIHDDGLYAVDFDLDPASLQLVEGRYGHNAGAGFCYDQQEETWDYTKCAIEIDDFEVGPLGRGLVLKGSAPGSDFRGREVWGFDQRGRKRPLTNDLDYDVVHLSVSAP